MFLTPPVWPTNFSKKRPPQANKFWVPFFKNLTVFLAVLSSSTTTKKSPPEAHKNFSEQFFIFHPKKKLPITYVYWYDLLLQKYDVSLQKTTRRKTGLPKKTDLDSQVCIICVPWRKVNSSLGTCHVCNNIFVKYSFDYGTVALGARNICMIWFSSKKCTFIMRWFPCHQVFLNNDGCVIFQCFSA